MNRAFNPETFHQVVSDAKRQSEGEIRSVTGHARGAELATPHGKSGHIVTSDVETFIAKWAPLIGLSLLLFLAIVPVFILYEAAYRQYSWTYLVREDAPLLAVSTFASLSFTFGAILYRRSSK